MTAARRAGERPTWFERALAIAPESRWLRVQDCDIHYLRWGPESASIPGRLFLHAGGAHAQWWSFIAPFFAQERPVAALDFSGMGDSGRRSNYPSAAHVAEIAAVLDDAGLGVAPIVVGHSFGGFMAMCHGHRFDQNLHGIVFVDTAVRPLAAAAHEPVKPYARPTRYSPDKDTILARFKLGPAQPCENGYILEFIAENSITHSDAGWTWKFDVAARGAGHHAEPLADYVRGLSCKKALIYASDSALVTPEVLPYLLDLFDGDPIVCIPEAHHHVFLDQPLAFVASLRAIVSGWRA